MVLAIIRSGFVAFPMSTRNSAPALEHLIRATSCRYIFGSVHTPNAPASVLQETTASVLSHIPPLHLLGVPEYVDLYPRLGQQPVSPYNTNDDPLHAHQSLSVRSYPQYANISKDNVVFYLQSSGSTNFPKPIPSTHKSWIGECRDVDTGGFDMVGSRWGVMGLPPFHGMGVCLMLGASAACGSISVMFNPSSPIILPTPENVIAACKRGKAAYLLVVPSMCVDWSHDKDAVKQSAMMKGVLYGGGLLPKETGDQLVKAGVKLAIEYGSTEAGLLLKFGMERYEPADWEYGERYPTMQAELVPEGNGLHRLIVDTHPIAVSNQPGTRAFDTSHLLKEHPTRKGFWKVIGRVQMT
ncbi:acetyl-CoA synthetase-like protein [Calocera cornea HHB12733]|uniref:Acetyl-CoA synthetase-like protein n=1 Tax=Calocera cornea HHB12733 TaxID=1353952 RepID=A0A165H110_9BASI|nr:acetyl-CoA synthetase-like protein [Calocera cornea HHB12733]